MITDNIKIKVKKHFEVDEFKQLLEQLKLKYVNYGSCIGTISVIPNSKSEALKLSTLLSRNIKVGIKTNIKISDIQKSLDDSIFDGIKVDELVFLFYPNIKSKKEITTEKNNYIDKKIKHYIEVYKNSNIEVLFNLKECLKKIKQLIIKDQKLLDNIFKSLIKLPVYDEDTKHLSIFSSTITGNPHYYDLDTHNSNTLIQFICYLFNFNYENKRNTKKEILNNVGILMDEVSNFVITYNLSGNEMLDSFKNNNTPLTLNLSNIRKMKNINSENNTLLIIENPSFFSRVMDKKINYSIIITSGNSNLVVYKLLEKINYSKMYFNGDFDPEGLLIAQNFKTKYPNVKFIGYNEEYYNNGISNNEISTSRLKKLDNVIDNDLLIIKELLKIKKLSSYQEINYDKLLEYIKKSI